MDGLIEYLTDIGLTEPEATLYIALKKTGPSTILSLSRNTNFKRTFVHNKINNLIKLGLVKNIKKGNKRLVEASHTEKIKGIILNKEKEAKTLEHSFNKFLVNIAQTYKKHTDELNFDFKYYEGADEVRHIYIEAASSKKIRAFINITKISSAYPTFFHEMSKIYDEIILSRKIKIWKLISDDNQVRRYKFPEGLDNFRYKFIPMDCDISFLDYRMYNGRVAIIYNTETITGVTIRNKDVYKSSLELFKLVWESLPAPETAEECHEK